MKYLLDTHTLLWLRLSPEKISSQQRRIIESSDEEKFVSSISAWEISLKFSLGKLDLNGYSPEQFISSIESIGLKNITPTTQQWATYHLLPKIEKHRDPFDRMLIWHALQSGLTLISSDKQFSNYQPHGLQLA